MPPQAILSAPSARRRRVDALTRWIVAAGGAAVIAAIALMFLHLLWVVLPILAPARVAPAADGPLAEVPPLPAAQTKLLALNDTGETALRIDGTGRAAFFDLRSGKVLLSAQLPGTVFRAKPAFPQANAYALLHGDGRLRFIETRVGVAFDGDARRLAPSLEFPYGEEAIAIGQVEDFDLFFGREILVASLTGERIVLRRFPRPAPGLGLGRPQLATLAAPPAARRLMVGPRGDWLYLLGSDGAATLFDLRRAGQPRPLPSVRLSPTPPVATEPLPGRHSLLVGQTDGILTQWSLTPSGAGAGLQRLREFRLASAPVRIVPEHRRKGFAVFDADGNLHLGHATSGRLLERREVDLPAGAEAALSPRGDLLVILAPSGKLQRYAIANAHPEISWSTLWSKVWYEGYPAPARSWQSYAADAEFEPKFSLAPLLFGTLKAAFYAMLFAAPVAVMSAVYTARFMAPSLRRFVKPGIEVMAALPTVVLGLLAGLWLAPLIEERLASVLTALALLPVGMLAFAGLWGLLPSRMRGRWEGFQGLIALAPVALLIWTGMQFGAWTEQALFQGDLKAWMRSVLGLDYDQRNALVVGLAMGLAVVPIIFAIAEDAIHDVPARLTHGSLALGATRWQTVILVVLPTASPGIFSAATIGFGRALGETMIVLMATGNTPIMNFNIFQGMRTLAANIAVEMPESAVNSSHYRILFLSALILFGLSFAFNGLAEVVRQRLRIRYGEL